MNGHFSRKLLPLLIASGLSLSTTVSADYQWSYQYNDKGQVTQSDGPRTDVSDITQYTYDPQGRLTQVVNALGHTSQLSNFDLFGSPQSIVDPNGLNISLSYDALGRLTSRTLHSTQGEVVTSYTYNAVGLLTRVTLPNGSWLDYGYDPARRLISITNNLGESISYTLDTMGNRTEEVVKNGSGQVTVQANRSFDEMGRLLELVGASGQQSQFSYDVDSNLTQNIDGNNNNTHQAFDALHRLVSVTNAHNQLTQFTYDKQDNVTSVTDPRGLVTTYVYDAFGRVTERNSPDTGVTTYAYDTAGNITQSTNAKGVVTTYEYDALNRLTAQRFPAESSQDITLTYDQAVTEGDNLNAGIGRLTQLNDRLGSETYRYDDRGNRIESIRQISLGTHQSVHTTVYHWDLADNLIGVEYPSGLSLSYTRNNAGQIEGVSYTSAKGTKQIATNISYQPFGGVKQLTWANGIDQIRSFDLDGRITSQQVGGLQTLNFQYDNVNNITQLLRNEPDASASGAAQSFSQTFAYDGLNQMTNEQGDYGEKAYTYDPVGNRTHRTTTTLKADGSPKVGKQTLTYFDDSNRIEKVGKRYLNYTLDGDIKSGLVNKHDYTYDETDRLSSFSKSGVLKAQYFYNGAGERTVKTVHSSTNQTHRIYEYDLAGQLLQETYYNAAGLKKQTYHYLWLDNQPLAYVKQIFKNSGVLHREELVYIHTDHLNTPRLATDASQRVVWRWDSDAFGYGKAKADPDGDKKTVIISLRFPGQYYDSESGLHYNYYRDYDPRTGRYIQSDPIGLQGGLNTYAYVMGNPLSYSDPFGLNPRGERGATGGSSGQNSKNPYKHCRQHPTKPNKIQCRHHQSGKWIDKPKPADWPGNNAERSACPTDSNCRKAATVVVVGGTSYIIYRCIRLLPSLAPPLWPTLPANIVTP